MPGLRRQASRRSRLPALAASLLAVAALGVGCTSIASWVFLPREGIRPTERGVRVERRVAMTTADGVELLADIYRPRSPGKTPTILVRIPLTRTGYNELRSGVIARFWATRGYTVVIQGTRGRFGSGGRFHPLRDERRDGIETLGWIAEQPWYDGRIGMWGGSSFGYTQWVVADQRDPGPAALILQICSSDFYSMFYAGGAFALESALYWGLRSGPDRDVKVTAEELERATEAILQGRAAAAGVDDLPLLREWRQHPERDDYWRRIDGVDRPRTVAAPALLMAGWFDPFLPSQLRDFVRIRAEAAPEVAAATRLIVGPWAHARTLEFPDGPEQRIYRRESLAPSIAWFDRQLGLAPAAPPEPAPVRLYVMGEHVWRDEQEWPLARTRYTSFYLRSGGRANTAAGDGRLARTPPEAPEPADVYTYDPRDPVPSAGGAMLGPRAGIRLQDEVEARPDVLVYTTEPLAADLEATGPVRAVLHVSTSAPSTDFTAKLVDVHPDGSAYNVSDGILRRAYDADGEPTEITIDLRPTSMVFRKGHRIRLEISSSNHPRFDRNPNTGRRIWNETEPVAATQTVHHGPATASRVVLPVIPRRPAAP